MNDPILKLKLLAKTEMTLGRLHARRALTRTALAAVSLLFVLMGIGMLNYAGYQSFANRFNPAVAALFIAIIDILIGVTVLALSIRTGHSGDEEKIAQEIRDLVYSELNADVDTLRAEFTKVSDDVHRIRSGFNTLTSGKISGVVGLVPLIEMLTRVLNKKKSANKQVK